MDNWGESPQEVTLGKLLEKLLIGAESEAELENKINLLVEKENIDPHVSIPEVSPQTWEKIRSNLSEEEGKKLSSIYQSYAAALQSYFAALQRKQKELNDQITNQAFASRMKFDKRHE